MESMDPIIRDGFPILKTNLSPPSETSQLDPQVKRGITICNLFVNYQLPIKEIAGILDESPRHVVHNLIQKGIV